jgi:hypothetical protein
LPCLFWSRGGENPAGFSRQTADAAADVQQQTGIAENLKLLADFVAEAAVDARSAV